MGLLMPKTNVQQVARGLIVDSLITYAAILRERGYSGMSAQLALAAWGEECHEMYLRVVKLAFLKEKDKVRDNDMDNTIVALLSESPDEHVEALIEERRGLLQDEMEEQLADIASPEDVSFREKMSENIERVIRGDFASRRPDIHDEVESGEDGA
jgi:hypothetical protein